MIEKYKSSWEYDCSSTPEAWTHNCYMLVNFVEGLKLKINELVDAVNALVYEHDKDSDWYDGQTCAKNVRLPYMQNKRLRKALGIAQSALVKLANDAYDFDEHIYIDKILNQIERITKKD